MIALTEAGGISLGTAIISAAALVLVAWLGNRQRIGRAEAKAENAVLAKAVEPTNGHETLGEGVAAIEDRIVALDAKVTKALEEAQAFRHSTDSRLDSLEDVATNPSPPVRKMTPKKPKGGTP